MKTPDEIKNGLEHCAQSEPCVDCVYDRRDFPMCVQRMAEDALAYIQQIEARIDTMTEKAVLFDEAVAAGEKYKRERDAAVEDLKSVVASNYFDGDYCKLCKYKEPDGECYHTCIPYSSKWGWEWRGVQEVE